MSSRVKSSCLDDDTILITSNSEVTAERLSRAVASYDPENKKYSTYLNEGITPSDSFTVEEIRELATNTQNDLTKVLKINAYNRRLVNENDIVGKVVEAIQTNINTELKLTYNRQEEGRNKKKRISDASLFINDFNDSIHINKFIRNGITTAYIEGNFVCYLRHEDPNNYQVDIYPLGVAEISEYDINGEPVVLINVRELTNKLSKTYKKTKKGKALFFAKLEEEIKANYPVEVYQAYMNKEDYAVLDHKYTGVVRINNMNRKYGVSPLLRAYRDIAMLDNFSDADRVNAKARGKKIIHQKMRKETMGSDYRKDYQAEMAYAHDNFMAAWRQSTVVVTSPPTVESIEYVEPTVEMTSKDTYNTYRSKVLATLGIQFLMDGSSQTVSTANISVEQLMRCINSISEGFEDVLYKWYRQVMIDNGFAVACAPKPRVIDSEQLSGDLRLQLAKDLFNIFNVSLDTVYGVLGLDVVDEANKRKDEARQGYDEVFVPRLTAYTNSGETKTNGRPKSGDSQTEEYNETYYDNN